jgi:hypothetical protein
MYIGQVKVKKLHIWWCFRNWWEIYYFVVNSKIIEWRNSWYKEVNYRLALRALKFRRAQDLLALMDILKNCKTSKFVKNVLKGGHPGQLKRRFFKNDKNYVISTFLGDFPMLRSFCFCKKNVVFRVQKRPFSPLFSAKIFFKYWFRFGNVGFGRDGHHVLRATVSQRRRRPFSPNLTLVLPSVSLFSLISRPGSASICSITKKREERRDVHRVARWNWTKKKTFFLRKWFFLPLSLCVLRSSAKLIARTFYGLLKLELPGFVF